MPSEQISQFAHREDAELIFCTGCYRGFDPALLRGEVELDLGCGSGSYTVALAGRRAQRTVLAADVMLGRLRKLVRRRRQAGLNNLHIVRAEARFLVGVMLPDGALDRVHLLCPDPWPKVRHSGHRLLVSDFASQLHRVLKPGGIFHFSSDDPEYCAAAERVMLGSGIFVADDGAIADLAGIRSDFESRWLEEGKRVRHIAFRTVPRPATSIGH